MVKIDNVRLSFSEKFRNHHLLWGLSKESVSDIVLRFTNEFDRCHQRGFDNSLNYHRDNRTPEEYIYDLFYGWAIEELVVLWLERLVKTLDTGAIVVKRGLDSDRSLKFKMEDITSLQDIEIIWSTGSRKRIEIQSTRQGRRDGSGYDHKRYKVARAIKDNSIFLWINPVVGEVFIVTVDDIKKKGVNSTAWGKDTYKIYDLPEDRYIKITNALPYEYQKLLGFTKSILRQAQRE